MSGKGSMVTTCCKIFHIKKFTQTFQESILNLFNMEPVEASEENFNKLIVEIAYSANQALGDEMNVVQIRYDLVGSNTTCTP